MRPLLTVFLLSGAILVTGIVLRPAPANADFVDQRTASAKPDPFFGPDGKPQKLDFDFGDAKAFIRDGGAYHLEAFVGHDSLLCATYELGIRFGIGRNGCEDVQWLGDTVYLSRRTQCNNATVFHRASEYDPALRQSFHRISCAERSVRCKGSCAAYVPPESQTDPGKTAPATPLFEQ